MKHAANLSSLMVMVLSEMPHLGMIHLVYESATLNEEVQLHIYKLISNNMYWFENEIQKCWLSDFSETGRMSKD